MQTYDSIRFSSRVGWKTKILNDTRFLYTCRERDHRVVPEWRREARCNRSRPSGGNGFGWWRATTTGGGGRPERVTAKRRTIFIDSLRWFGRRSDFRRHQRRNRNDGHSIIGDFIWAIDLLQFSIIETTRKSHWIF